MLHMQLKLQDHPRPGKKQGDAQVSVAPKPMQQESPAKHPDKERQAESKNAKHRND